MSDTVYLHKEHLFIYTHTHTWAVLAANSQCMTIFTVLICFDIVMTKDGIVQDYGGPKCHILRSGYFKIFTEIIPWQTWILREYALLNFYGCYGNTTNNNTFQNL